MSKLVALAALTCLLVPGPLFAAGSPSLAGTWLGALEVPGGKLRIVFNVEQKPDGSYTATVDSPDQGAKGLKVDTVTLKDGAVTIELLAIGGKFEGKLSADGKKAEGKWSQSGSSLPLTVERVDQVPEPKRPQTPKKPYPYREEEVSYDGGAPGVKLAATLTLPSSGGPFPAAVLITGSGPQDRDEAVFGHRTFLVLADYLTRRGIAVLRADDRGVGASTGEFAKATTEDSASDALAGVAYLKTRPEIDAARIGLVGHSEGGEVGPMAAVRSPEVSFVVMLDGSGVTGEEIIYEQQALISKALGAPDKTIAQERARMEEDFAIVKQEPDNAVAEKRLRALAETRMEGLPDDQKKVAEATLNAELGQVLTPWFRFFLTYDPRSALVKVKVPVLALWGEKDLQVPPKQSLPAVQAALTQGGNQHYTLKVLPGLNHLLQTAKTGSPTEYVQIEETMAPAALQVIGDWVLEQAHVAGSAVSGGH